MALARVVAPVMSAEPVTAKLVEVALVVVPFVKL